MLKSASAGNRTRIYCLEGNNANLYTTDADDISDEEGILCIMLHQLTSPGWYIINISYLA